MAPSVYDYISECATFDAASDTLKNKYIKPKNEIFARHLLATRKQQPGETLDKFLVELKTLAKDCNFVAVTPELYKSQLIRDAFINGLNSSNIRQTLLENQTLTLDAAFTQARALDVAQQNSNVYGQNMYSASFHTSASSHPMVPEHPSPKNSADSNTYAATRPKRSCWFCGNDRHLRSRCPAREVF